MLRFFVHSFVVVFLTALTQIGGLAWMVSRLFRRKLLWFLLIYGGFTVSAIWFAPVFGRVALSCWDKGPLQVQSWTYCALNRNYVSVDLKDVLLQTAEEMDMRFTETDTLVLDANFPFFDGFPLLPHLSHHDGNKVDIAFYYRDDTGYLKGDTRSPIGYFAFEDGPTECAQNRLTLRWDLGILQPLWHDYELDMERNRAVLQILTRHDKIGKIFVEPHLVRTLDTSHANIRFQGCRAARHDDHIHLQLR